MAEAEEFDPGNAFEIVAPAEPVAPLVFNSPHSGSRYPASLLARTHLNARAVRQSEDTDVDRLFEAAIAGTAPLLHAHFPRAWLDVNREPFELDPKMFDGTLPSFANTRSARVAAGLGTIPRVVADGKAIYTDPLPVTEALDRIETVYVPYHRALRRLLDRTHEAFGMAILIDCHSMPSTVRTGGLRKADFVLGDRHGSSCADALTDLIEAALVRRGYDVSRNRPYAGGFITEHYGRPKHGTHAIQIEINRSLYLNERTLERSKGYDPLQADLAGLVMELVRDAQDAIEPPRVAAE